MKKKLLGILFLILAVVCIASAAAEGGQNALIGGAAGALMFLILGLRFLGVFNKKKKAEGYPQKYPPMTPAAPPKPTRAFVSFKVAGVIYRNEDGSDRQTILRHLKFLDPPYIPAGTKEAVLAFENYTYEGEPAIHITVNGYTIGNVPRANIQEVTDALKRPGMSAAYTIYGGNGHNYGCEVSIGYDI